MRKLITCCFNPAHMILSGWWRWRHSCNHNTDDANTSYHIPVTLTLKLKVATIDVKPVSVRVKPKRDKCTVPQYNSYISRQLQTFNSPQTGYELELSWVIFASTLKCAEIVILAHRIRISEILPWDRKSYLTHAILPRTSSNVIMWNCIIEYSGLLESYFKINK